MDAREYLSQVAELESRIESHAVQLARLGRLQARGERALPPEDEAIGRIAALKEELRGEIETWSALRREAAQAIAAVPKESHRRLLEYRYLCGWDLRRIAVKMNYSMDRMWHLHTDALREFRVPEQVSRR